MSIQIRKAGETISQENLEHFEKQLNACLPQPYRQFLLKNNGGVPSPDTIDIDGLKGTPTDVQVFFGIGRVVESSNIIWNKVAFKDWLPNNFLPIACDSGGNLFCITFSGADTGVVTYIECSGPNPIYYVVARDFNSFEAKIR